MMNVDEQQKIQKFTDLNAWRESRKLVKDVYRACYLFPQAEQYGLVSQMKRAAVSVPSNIVEGFKRETMKDKLHFYVIAHGSLTELENQVILSHDLQFIDERSREGLMTLVNRVDRLLTGLIRASKERL